MSSHIILMTAGVVAVLPNQYTGPFRKLVGVILLLLGLFDSLIFVTVWGLHPIVGLTASLDWLVTIALGVVLIFALTDKGGLNENADTTQRSGNMRQKLARLKLPLGLFAILLGIWDYILSALVVMWF